MEHILTDLNYRELVSPGIFCNGRCTVELTQENINTTKNHIVKICGHRNCGIGLWDIPINLTTPY